MAQSTRLVVFEVRKVWRSWEAVRRRDDSHKEGVGTSPSQNALKPRRLRFCVCKARKVRRGRGSTSTQEVVENLAICLENHETLTQAEAGTSDCFRAFLAIGGSEHWRKVPRCDYLATKERPTRGNNWAGKGQTWEIPKEVAPGGFIHENWIAAAKQKTGIMHGLTFHFKPNELAVEGTDNMKLLAVWGAVNW